MPPKRATNKKAATKVAASSADAKVSNNGEKEVVEELATDAKNGSALNDAEESKESTISKAPTKRSSGRGKNVASELETETPASKKPAAKGRGKKKTNENEVIENDAPQAESQEAEETTTTKENEEVEAVTKPKGRGGGGKKAEPKAKNTSKAKVAESVQDEESNEAEEAKGTVKKSRTVAKAKVAESVQDEESNEAEEAKGTAKKSRTVAGKRKKQEAVTKAEEEVEVKQEIEEELMEKAPKKSSRNSKKTEEIPADIEPQKKKGRAAKKEKVVDKEEVKEEVEEVEVKVDVKEKKPTKRGRGVAKAAVVAEETAAANGDAEEVLPKKRSRKAPSVEKEIVPEKPKRGGRAKKAEKLAEESSSSPVQGKEEDEISNGEVKQENLEEIEETPSSTKEVAEETEEPAAPAKKTRGGRKRAAPSTNKKKTAKTAADDNNELDDGVDNADMDDEADGSKPSKSKKNKTGTAPLNATATKYDKADFELPPPADGQTVEEPRFNLKISSWNVAGLRSWLKKEGLKYLEYEEPDIFCMQETKCTTEQLPEEVVRIPGYHPYWLCMPGGYAGVAIYSKIMPINVEYGIGHKEFDDCGRIITAEYEKFFLINVYVPNSGRKLVNLEARMKWEKLFQEFIKNLDARKPVVICGDMNVSHQEHDLANPKTNTRNAGFTKEERDKMSELLALGYVDTFRHLYPERKGAYTFWTYMGNARSRNVGWRLDYFIVSERFIKRVVDNCIRSQCLGSDHCPITLFLKL
ncbi:recombination repair protein 1 isoform X2 [Calliphora vicina]|uniref:recombination repair protein 1 isoform X2 n=1 Tax=Calliphora vicina TaxID=7373 RepID=UPI00325B0DB5